MDYAAHPHHIREMAREATYPNSEVERRTVQEIDREVFARVWSYERWAFDNCQAFLSEQKSHVQAAAELMADIKADVRSALLSGEPAEEVAERFEALRQKVELTKAKLRRAAETSRYHEERVADPYAAMCKMWDRFPVLRPRFTR